MTHETRKTEDGGIEFLQDGKVVGSYIPYATFLKETKWAYFDGGVYVRQWFPCGILRYFPIQISLWLKCGKWRDVLVDTSDEKLLEWQAEDGDFVVPIEINSLPISNDVEFK